MKIRVLLAAIVVMLVSAACQAAPQLLNETFLSDTSLVTGEPCEAPCWRNITPGETTWLEARIIIEDDSQLTNLTTEDVEEGGSVLLFNDGEGPQCCQIYTQDGETVTQVLTLLAPEMTLGQVLAKYGEPEYMTGADVSPDQTLVLLVFPDVPLGLYVFAPGIETGSLAADNQVIGAIYLNPDDIDELLNTDLYYWEGYGALSGMIDGEFDVRAVEATDGDTTDESTNADDSADDGTADTTPTEDATSSD
ncbi:MAG: hypothetical protein KC546_05755 [Anaerolineae bacterium]|nr:hypothetical protein [Anaerolineae bacterium]MCA9887853.1 hypothetical protein [Anaerolineae bacterium]MCA9895084.1 hypothetical protein [Anaerolineae bacterium]